MDIEAQLAYLIPLILLNIEDSNDLQAAINLFLKYGRFMYHTAFKIIGDHQTAEDVAQDASLKIISRMNRIKNIEPEKEQAYIAAIVRNLAINSVIKRNRQNKYAFLTDDNQQFERASEENTVESRLLRDCEIDVIKNALEKMKDNEGSILKMKYFDKLPDEHIAQVYDINVNSVRTYLTRARRHFASILKEEYGFE